MNKSSINKSLIYRKLEQLQQYAAELSPVAEQGFENYQKDFRLRRQAERSLELAIMTACDINSHLVAKLTGRPPADYYNSFLKLAEIGICPPEFAQKMAPAAGLRNRLQHEYNQIDDRLVFEAISHALDDLPRFIKYILAFTSSPPDY